MPTGLSSVQTNPRRLLIRGVNWLGDAVMTTPALLRLRERFADACITLITPEKLADLWLHHPSIDQVITFKPGESVLRVASRIRGWKFTNSAAQFQRGRLTGDFALVPFDTALILPNSPRSAFECWLARIPARVGYARAGRNLLLTQAIAARPGHKAMRKRSKREIEQLISNTHPAPPSTQHPSSAHQVHEYLYLAAQLGASPEPLPPRLEVTEDEIKASYASLIPQIHVRFPELRSDRPPPILALNPGAAYGPAKRWYPERFAAVAREICKKRPDVLWIALGSPEDTDCCEQIIRLASGRIVNLAGRTTLRQLMAFLKLSRLLLTNDSGPMHVAAALGTAVVVAFGSTSFQLTGPGLPGDSRNRLLTANAPCSPCFLPECPIDFRCMTEISVDKVANSVMELLA
jgi:heptosyltransferase-2